MYPNKKYVPTIEKITWQDARVKLQKVNPELTAIIDKIDPDDSYPLYKARYPYGSIVLEKGRFYYPTKGGQLATFDKHPCNILKNDFSYVSDDIPVGIVTEHTLGFLVESKHGFLPWATFIPGRMFSLWRHLDDHPSFHPGKLFSLTAGSRCIFMLPNIADHALHKNLKRDFNVHLPPPKNLLDQWAIFSRIVHHPDVQCDWYTEVILFTNKWLEKIKHDPAWCKLYIFCFRRAWNYSNYWRNRMFYDFAFSVAQANRNLKPNPYLADTAQHLLAIGAGAAPGFKVANNTLAAPINLIQKAYLDSYGLKHYVPTMIHPRHLSIHQKKPSPVYYSLQLPTTFEFSPKSRKVSSTLAELSEIKYILTVFLEAMSKQRLGMENTALEAIINRVKFDYFHSKADKHSEIKLTQTLPESDPRFLKSLADCNNTKFADNGTFIRGCVQINLNL